MGKPHHVRLKNLRFRNKARKWRKHHHARLEKTCGSFPFLILPAAMLENFKGGGSVPTQNKERKTHLIWLLRVAKFARCRNKECKWRKHHHARLINECAGIKIENEQKHTWAALLLDFEAGGDVGELQRRRLGTYTEKGKERKAHLIWVLRVAKILRRRNQEVKWRKTYMCDWIIKTSLPRE